MIFILKSILLFIKIIILSLVKSILNIDWFKVLPIILPIILSIAFLTLIERKILGAMQRRKGPNVVGYWGFLQAFADGVKLILKETIIPYVSNFLIFMTAPIIIFSLSLASWALIPFTKGIVIVDIDLGILMLLAISSLSVYGIIFSGWSSNSKYALFGALRSTAQMISYEISIGLLIMPVIFLSRSTNFSGFVFGQKKLYNAFPFFTSFILFFICILAETNRLPFDLPEAESELVSGYNVEYSALTFAFFFLAEYSFIILMSTLIVILYLGGWECITKIFNILPLFIWLLIKELLIIFIFVWVRATLPRYRYDQLMWIGWKWMLPVSLGFLLLSLYIILFFN